MRKMLIIGGMLFTVLTTIAQTKKAVPESSSNNSRPKLVVGIVVDQMRWDYLYRYYDRFGADGFRRLIDKGFSCENTFINYLPSYTAVGHTTIFTGSVPALSGITGNNWIEQLTGKTVYCTQDSTVDGVGAKSAEDGKMSPRNMLVSTITDELRMATNFKSKVVGVSLKDRASILPAGHMASAAYWFDDESGNFISSTYYMKELPPWAVAYNERKRPEQLVANGWNTLFPKNTYTQSDEDDRPYEGKFTGEKAPVFPHDMTSIYEKSRGSFRSTPFGNTLTLEFAEQALDAYQLGRGTNTDFLTINCASTDYVGHMYGPNSIEVEDTYLRLDKDLASFFQMLDAKIGKGQYLVFLSADHGAAHSVGYLQDHGIPSDFWYGRPMLDTLNKILADKFGTPRLIRSFTNYQVNFDLNTIESKQLDINAIKKVSIEYLQRQPGINTVIDVNHVGNAPIPEKLRMMIANGYNFKRSGPVQIILNAGWFEGYSKTGTTHGTWNPYDTHIPLLFYGWKIKHGKTNRETYMTDIAATVAALIHVQMPNGCIGTVIEEVTR